MRMADTIDAERAATQPPLAKHPLGSRARVLLTSVFGPYACDDEHGSRTINPMELYHNQVTRVQGPFSLRMFHRSWGLSMIQANIAAPCTLLDFPSLDRFVEEISSEDYDVVGISSIIPNVKKVHKMCQLIREHLPDATIVVGGHIANMPDLNQRIDADHVVRGEGVRWMRRFLSEDENQPVEHPAIYSGIGARTMGITLREECGDVAATLIPSVGCPMGCNFCSTSAMFGGKGKCVHFYETGDELFRVMCDIEQKLKITYFFVMDENFLLYRKRALRLLELMEEHSKPWGIYVFSSANVLRSYTIDQLVGLGVSWVWMGLEGEDSTYAKLKGTDTRELVRSLQENGIRVLGSSIIGLEDHTPLNIDDRIEHAVNHDTEFHQFMLYTPIPGTPLYTEHKTAGTLLDECEIELADTHGQDRFNYKHPHIKNGQETDFLKRAFQRDFDINGPSVIRVIRTTLLGWQRYKNHPNPRIRARFIRESRDLPGSAAGAVWAARRWYRSNHTLEPRLSKTLRDLYTEFGIKARIAAPLIGRFILWKLRRETTRLRNGWTCEPPTFRETNRVALTKTPSDSIAS